MKVLVVVDMQNDFIDGVLGSQEAIAIIPVAKEAIQNFNGKIFCTLDTHTENYMQTQEGKNLPISHCIKGTQGWLLHPEIASAVSGNCELVEKPTFGSQLLGERLQRLHEQTPIEEIVFLGVCTDICVISNVLLTKAFLPEVPISVLANACAGVTPESHKTALEAMKACQIEVCGE